MKVERGEPELVLPSNPTPHVFKPLSDLDDQDGLRFHILVVQVYPRNPSMDGVDPAKVIKDAIAKALVFYYPLAGRLREVGPTRKLIVECNAEGVLFIEADADITIQESGNSLLPPFPYLDELLYNVSGSDGVLNCPLLLIQITRMKCGGFVWALRVNHAMVDGPGLKQFMLAVGEIARGEQVIPSIMPIWKRHVLSARNLPTPTCFHPEYENNQTSPIPLDKLVHRAFFLGPEELGVLRRFVPPHFGRCSTFEILTACMWKCRTIALQPKPTQIMRMTCLVNVRGFNPPLLPEGYYGNGFLLSTVTSTTEELIQNPLEYALGLIKRTKYNVTKDYVQSALDTLVSKGRPLFHVEGTYIMSDNTRFGFEHVDVGWGNAIFGGVPRSIPTMASFLVSHQNKKGEKGIIVPIGLPIQAMEIFAKELNNMLQHKSAISSL